MDKSLKNEDIITRKKIAMCFFSPIGTDYVPTDIGYLIAILQAAGMAEKYDFEIIQFSYDPGQNNRKIQANGEMVRQSVVRDVDLLEYHQPDVTFIFLDNVLWSKILAFGRAVAVAEEIKRRQPQMFIGFQSYKLQKEQSWRTLEEKKADCVINGNPEISFLQLEHILKKEYVEGVQYLKEAISQKKDKSIKNLCGMSDNSLDYLPSPYLNHIFDNYLQARQREKGDNFRTFVVSSRGCSFGCYYCFRSVKFDRVRYFSAKRFYEEIEYLFNSFKIWRFFVLDDAFLYSKERIKEFVVEFQVRLEKNPGLKKIEFFIMARPETIDEEMIDYLAALQVKYIQIGLQTINPALQHYMKRGIDVSYFKKIREWMRKYNIGLHLDIVIGLPGDSAEWFKATLRYALSLDPFSLQLKQFYLNPNTLFQVKKERYGIKIEECERYFDVPYVVKTMNMEPGYFEKVDDFVVKKSNEYPHIRWKYLTEKNSFLHHAQKKDV